MRRKGYKGRLMDASSEDSREDWLNRYHRASHHDSMRAYSQHWVKESPQEDVPEKVQHIVAASEMQSETAEEAGKVYRKICVKQGLMFS